MTTQSRSERSARTGGNAAPSVPHVSAVGSDPAAPGRVQPAEQLDTQRLHDSTVVQVNDRLEQTTEQSGTTSRPAGLLPFVSIVVPVRNEERFICSTLEQLLEQDYSHDRFEILVVDGRSTDQTRDVVGELAREHPNLRLLDNPRRLSSAARNVGIQHARGQIILVVDGHCEIPSRQMLRNLAEAFAESSADCLGRPQPLEVSGATPLQRAIAAARSSWLGHHPDSFIYAHQPQFVPAKSVAVAYRREVFDRVGLFDERFDACEDVELNHRIDKAGLKCYFTPQIAVRYFPRETLGGLFRQLVRYGRGRVRLARKHPETLSLRTLLPAAALLAGVLMLVASAFFSLAAATCLSALVAYCFVIIAVCVSIAIQRADWALAPWLPLVFAVIHFGAGAGLWTGIILPRRQQAARLPSAASGEN